MFPPRGGLSSLIHKFFLSILVDHQCDHQHHAPRRSASLQIALTAALRLPCSSPSFDLPIVILSNSTPNPQGTGYVSMASPQYVFSLRSHNQWQTLTSIPHRWSIPFLTSSVLCFRPLQTSPILLSNLKINTRQQGALATSMSVCYSMIAVRARKGYERHVLLARSVSHSSLLRWRLKPFDSSSKWITIAGWSLSFTTETSRSNLRSRWRVGSSESGGD